MTSATCQLVEKNKASSPAATRLSLGVCIFIRWFSSKIWLVLFFRINMYQVDGSESHANPFIFYQPVSQ